ncbi:hypothetical protein E5206_06765 [Arthrobacter sp. PAMC25564]|uniref:hypothetical protein n=1 Tax=Arthrobacter sp. PAMC25564 TaxID=2565366 RepID=UPI0010A1FC6B|nr:hypothetical protein [Arthrobacter sp. PAMC25564]QCB96667.1 hypothetical protein E5206_06765 [Arthrobacter sp. PAMC25564]
MNSKATSTQRYPDMMNTISTELGWPASPNPWTALVVFVSTPTLSDGAYGAGWSYNGASGRVIMPLPGPGQLTNSVITHEFGHVFGLMHANALQCGSGAQDVATNADGSFADASCSIQEYKDTLDLMGASQASQPVISSPMWEYGGFGNGQEILNAGTALGRNSYQLTAWSGAADNRAVKFTDAISGEVYYLELRLPVGNDSAVATGGNRGVKIVQALGAGSIALPPSTLAFAGYYSKNQAWQAGQTFTTHAGTRVSIDWISDAAAGVTVTAMQLPLGSFDALAVSNSASGTSLQVSGWAVDMADSSVSTQAHVYITRPDGSTSGYAVPANGSRPDLDQVLHVGPNHGFSQEFGVTAPGTYKVCVYAIGKFGNPQLGCKTQTVIGTPSPIGSLDQATISGNSITARGWTLDPGTPGTSIPAHIYITAPDGTTKGTAFTADQARPDVNQVIGVSGNHGYTATIPITQPGSYKVCAYGIAVTALSNGNSLLGCQTIQAPRSPSPIGSLDQATISGNSITARGWTLDPGTPGSSIPAHIYITAPDGTTKGTAFTADQARPDVNQVIGVSGNHGYTATIPITQPGSYKVCAYGIAVTALSNGNSLLGCQTIQAPRSPSPIGSLDQATISGNSITARGWTLDPGTPGSSIPVHIYITAPDGTTKGTAFTADQARPDVNQVIGVSGNHGYTATIPITQPGGYKVCAYGIAVTALSNGNSLLGCQTMSY